MGHRSNKILAVLLIGMFGSSVTLPQTHGAGGSAKPQVNEGLGRTWKGPSVSVIGRILTRRPASTGPSAAAAPGRRPKTTVPAPSTPVSAASLTFKPAGDSGIADGLAAAFSTNAGEKALLTTLFKTVKQSYETEVAKDGKSNNIAAALTFFLAINAMVYHGLGMPSDEETEKTFARLRDAMNSTPEIGRMTNAEKQQMHDWLVCMGGFVLAGYLEAKQNKDAETLASFREVAALASRIVGVDITKVKLTANGLETASLEPPPYKIIFGPELRSDPLS